MKTKLFLLLLVLCLALTSCNYFPQSTTKPIPTSAAGVTAADLANDLEQAIAEDDSDVTYRYATNWILHYGLDGFIQDKLISVEQVYDAYFIREVPEAKTVAKTILQYTKTTLPLFRTRWKAVSQSLAKRAT